MTKRLDWDSDRSAEVMNRGPYKFQVYKIGGRTQGRRMKKAVVASRRLQFAAGPESNVFYACAEHMPALLRADVTCFLAMKHEPLRHVFEDLEESEDCWFCREG